MPIIDAQVHAYERDRPERPWHAVLHGPPEVTGHQMVAALDANRVDGAILVSAFTMYRFDPSYALAVRAAYPNRFAVVKPVDPGDPGVADTVADWARTPGAVAVRIMLNRGMPEDPADPGLNRVLAAAGKAGIPVNLLCWGRLGQAAEMARRNPDTQIVVDHIGLQQPFEPPAPPNPWADVPNVCALAALPNVAIKISGACTLSHVPFPYGDIWDPLSRIFDAFGLDRCLWGTDWTRAVGLLTFQRGVDSFRDSTRLSADDKAKLMGGSLAKIYRWSPTAG